MADEFRPRDYSKRESTVDGWPVGITSYWLEGRCIVLIDNVDPGATIARAEAATFEEAQRAAVDTARERLAGTRRRRETLRELHDSVASLEEAVRSKR